MAKFLIEYIAIEKTRQRIEVEADTAEEARQIVEEYNFDNSESWETDCLTWEIDEVEFVKVD